MAEQDRTTAFFEQSVGNLTRELQGRVIVDRETDRRIILTRLEVYPRNVGPIYGAIAQLNMQPGELWVPYIPRRKMRQSLVIAKSEEVGIGACVRIVRASNYDQRSGIFVSLRLESDIANYLELRNYERGILRFLDETDNLYLLRTEETNDPRSITTQVSPGEADEDLTRLLQ